MLSGERKVVCWLAATRQGAATDPPAIRAPCVEKVKVGWLAVTEGIQIAPRQFLCLPGEGHGPDSSERAGSLLCVAVRGESESGLEKNP